MALRLVFFLCIPRASVAQTFSCPPGQIDVMKYFAMSQQKRTNQFMTGKPNSIYTIMFPNEDFADTGYWFWLKSPKAHGFDIKSFDSKYVYMRSTELVWKDNSTFKRFAHDLLIADRCISEGKPGREIKVADTTFQYFSGCRPYKTGRVGIAVNDLDKPEEMDAGGNLGRVWTRVLHYHYDCDRNYRNCKDEEEFYLANGYGLWQWKHYRNGSLIKSALMNEVQLGQSRAWLPCLQSFEP